MARLLRVLLFFAAALAVHEWAGAADLSATVGAIEKGWVRFSCAVRGGPQIHSGTVRIVSGRSVREGCADDRLHAAVRVEAGGVREVRLRSCWTPAGVPEDATDLGEVPAGVAAAFFAPLVRARDAEVAEQAVVALGVVDAETWPELLAVARSRDLPGSVREDAVFWLSRQAADRVTAALATLVADDDEDLQLREHAIFALSEAGGDAGVAALTNIALENPHPQLRRQAFFWLAQHDDPAVLDLFERILLD
jgi:hypothetical protein